jgi:alpha-D-xyloside xylohydrolase
MVAPVTEYMRHRPPEPSVLVPAESLRTADGKPGLAASYHKGSKFQDLSLEKIDPQIDVYWYGGRPEYVTDQTFSIRWKGKVVPSETGRHQFHIKCFGARRIILDGKLLPYVSQSVEAYTDFVELEAGREYDLVVEAENEPAGAARVILNWKTPSILAREQLVEERKQTRAVYLPSGTRWIDFWTGETHEGGQTLEADAPIDELPLMVRAGSIVPMGPVVQHAMEKPNAPLELRIYPGADGRFTLYDDEGDNYNYEHGLHATTRLVWDDARRELTLEAREGSYPGMAATRAFRVVGVRPGSGTGVEETAAPTRVVTYDGTRQVVSLAASDAKTD